MAGASAMTVVPRGPRREKAQLTHDGVFERGAQADGPPRLAAHADAPGLDQIAKANARYPLVPPSPSTFGMGLRNHIGARTRRFETLGAFAETHAALASTEHLNLARSLTLSRCIHGRNKLEQFLVRSDLS